MRDVTPQSPCISVCVLDSNDVCMGCYRSAVEITDWFMATDEEKKRILARSQERQRTSTTIRLN